MDFKPATPYSRSYRFQIIFSSTQCYLFCYNSLTCRKGATALSYIRTSWRFARQSIAPIARPIKPIVKLKSGSHLEKEMTSRQRGSRVALTSNMKSAVNLWQTRYSHMRWTKTLSAINGNSICTEWKSSFVLCSGWIEPMAVLFTSHTLLSSSRGMKMLRINEQKYITEQSIVS